MKTTKTLLALLTAALVSACGGSDNDTPATPTTTGGATQPITQVAELQGFNALLAAAAKAGLAPALAAPDANLTVFAPTDAAFNSLAQTLGYDDAGAMVAALPEATLRDILSYHVLPDTLTATELVANPQSTQATLYQLDGQPTTLAVDTSGGVSLTDAVLTEASVTAADVSANNGVIHAIDKVLVPPGVLNIVQMAQLNPALSSLVDAVLAADLQDALSGPGPLTVFAPTNAAFAAAPTGLSTTQLATVLTYHVLGDEVRAADIPFGTPVTTLANQDITIQAGTPPTISDTTAMPAAIGATDIRASNGVIHLIDKVLIPAL